jgi:long-chain acyl-CoA synthetase
MNILKRYPLSRDRSVTVANLVDEMLRRKGNCKVSVSESGVRSLVDLHAEIFRGASGFWKVVGSRRIPPAR